jgi:hypothetical protein
MRFGEIYIREGSELHPAPTEYLGYHENDREIFSQILRQVTDTATRSLGQDRSIEITVASVPSGLDSIASEHLHYSIIRTDASSLQHGWQKLQFLDAARLAYDLDSCEAFDQPPSCNLEAGGPYTILYVDQTPNYLDLWAADVGEFTVAEFEHNRIQHSEAGEATVCSLLFHSS